MMANGKVLLFLLLSTLAILSVGCGEPENEAEISLNAASGVERVDMLNETAGKELFFWTDIALKSAAEAKKLSQEIGYLEGEAEAYRLEGKAFRVKEKFEESLLSQQKAVSLAAKSENSSSIAAAKASLAIALIDAGRLEEANTELIEATELNNQQINKTAIDILVSRAELAHQKLLPDEGEALLIEAIQIARDLEDRQSEGYLNCLLSQNRGLANDTDAALNYITVAIETFREIDREDYEAYCKHSFAVVLQNAGKYGESIEYFDQAIELFEKNGLMLRVATSKDDLGYSYYLLGMDDKTLSNYNEVLDIYESLGRTYDVTRTKGNIIGIIQGQASIDYAYAFLADGSTKTNNMRAIVTANIASRLINLERYDEAIEVAKEVLAFPVEPETQEAKLVANYNLAIAYLESERSNEAIGYFKEAVALVEELNMQGFYHHLYTDLVAYYNSINNPSRALVELEKLSPMIEASNSSYNKRVMYEYYSEAYEQLGDFKNALKFARLDKESNAVLTDEDLIRERAIQSVKFGIKLKDSEIALLEQENKIDDLRLERQYMATMSVTIGLILLILLATAIYVAYRIKAKAFIRMEELALTDSLTGLFNRRVMHEKLNEEIERGKRSEKQFSVIISDIDHFKQFNDSFGHDCGDYVLKKVAETLAETVRSQDVLSRWGGEEFLVLLPETDMEAAALTAERLRSAVENAIFDYKGQTHQVRMTFGVSQSNAEAEKIVVEALINSADEALYEGKEGGRNCVVCAAE